MNYCPLKVQLIPDVTCICLLYVRPRQEEFVLPTKGTFVETNMEPAFSLEVPPGAFEEDACMSMKVGVIRDDFSFTFSLYQGFDLLFGFCSQTGTLSDSE